MGEIVRFREIVSSRLPQCLVDKDSRSEAESSGPSFSRVRAKSNPMSAPDSGHFLVLCRLKVSLPLHPFLPR